MINAAKILCLAVVSVLVALPMTVFAVAGAGDGTTTLTRVIKVPGADSAQVLAKVREWSTKYAKTYDADDKSGTIVADGEIAYPSPPVDRIQYTFTFRIKHMVQGGADQVAFENVMLKSPTEYIVEGAQEVPGIAGPVRDAKDLAARNRVLARVADNLESYLLSRNDANCQLYKCPECSVLCASPEEMKMHEKGHEHKMMEHKGH